MKATTRWRELRKGNPRSCARDCLFGDALTTRYARGIPFLKKTPFLFMMWGILFILLNLRLQHVNILPNFVGFLLCAIGLRELRMESVKFQRLYVLNYILLAWSLLRLVVPVFRTSVDFPMGQPVSSMGYGSFLGLSMLLTIAAMIVQFIWVLWLIQGIKEMALTTGQLQLLPTMTRAWSTYVVSLVLSAVTIVLGLSMNGAVIPLVIVSFIVGVATVAFFMNLLYRCGHEL